MAFSTSPSRKQLQPYNPAGFQQFVQEDKKDICTLWTTTFPTIRSGKRKGKCTSWMMMWPRGTLTGSNSSASLIRRAVACPDRAGTCLKKATWSACCRALSSANRRRKSSFSTINNSVGSCKKFGELRLEFVDPPILLLLLRGEQIEFENLETEKRYFGN